MAQSTIKSFIAKTAVTDTTTTAGILITNIPFDDVIGVTFATAGMNYYALPRRANAGNCVAYIVDANFRPITETQLSVNIWHRS